MSRRPAYDEVDTVVVINEQQPNARIPQDSPYKSNLLSNDNVIAFASGVVIDDGSSVSATASTVQHSRR